MNDRPAPKCKYCGSEMVKQMQSRFNQMMGTKEYHGHYACQMCGSSAPESEYLTDLSAAEESAYAAATRTPPNRPLTRAQVAEKDGYDAVWRVNKMSGYLYRPMSAKDVRDLIECESVNYCENLWYFAAKPTPADIEAARKGIDCK
jgi:hypothetical protein